MDAFYLSQKQLLYPLESSNQSLMQDRYTVTQLLVLCYIVHHIYTELPHNRLTQKNHEQILLAPAKRFSFQMLIQLRILAEKLESTFLNQQPHLILIRLNNEPILFVHNCLFEKCNPRITPY